MLRQEQKLEQKQILTQYFVHSLKILQLNTNELESYLQVNLDNNPFLEAEYFDDNSYPLADYSEYEKKIELLRDDSYDENSLEQLLHEQLNNHSRSDLILNALVDSLDQRAYLEEDVIEWLTEDFKISKNKAEEAVSRIQSCLPKGIGARNLAECICLQLESNDYLAINIIQMYQDALIACDYKYISDQEAVSLDDVEEAISRIRSCNPFPGNGYSRHQSSEQIIIPDISIERHEGELIFNLRKQYGGLRVNQAFYRKVKYDLTSCLREQYQNAQRIVVALHKRVSTLALIAAYLIQKQVDYFDQGIDFLKRITLRQCAKELQLHPSTLTRALQNKYCEFEGKVYPLKHFFCQKGIGAYTEYQIKYRIKDLVKNYNTDMKVAEQLNQEGIKISRRLVTKYRNEMKIPALRRKDTL